MLVESQEWPENPFSEHLKFLKIFWGGMPPDPLDGTLLNAVYSPPPPSLPCTAVPPPPHSEYLSCAYDYTDCHY